jgi:sugar phosphate isomerase/epimerase
MYTRRELGRWTLGSLASAAALAKPNSNIHGVRIGAQSYSFRDRPLDAAIQGMREVGLSHCALWQGHVEPRLRREELRKWRSSVPLGEFEKVREKFKKAGIAIYAYYYSFRDDFSDQEIARGFAMAKALGVKYLEASSNVTTAKRVDPYAARANVYVGMHNHASLVPNEFARPEDFEQAMRGMSHIRINLDIGHFVAAGFDPVAFIRRRHADIITLDIKDRTREQGTFRFGQGATPIREVLRLLKTNRYKIPAMIEYEYKGDDTVTEVKRCYEYCKQALA